MYHYFQIILVIIFQVLLENYETILRIDQLVTWTAL